MEKENWGMDIKKQQGTISRRRQHKSNMRSYDATIQQKQYNIKNIEFYQEEVLQGGEKKHL
eukprot:8376909-Ditylum_brightwellii.AAC.1